MNEKIKDSWFKYFEEENSCEEWDYQTKNMVERSLA